MNPPEQTPALQQLYEARQELVRQNEAEISDLKRRLEQATGRNKGLVAQMVAAKENFEEAASKIVDLLDDEDGKGDESGDGSYEEYYGNESKHCRPSSRGRNANKIRKKTRVKYEDNGTAFDDDEDKKRAASQHKICTSRMTSPFKPTRRNYAENMMANEVVDLLEGDDNDGDSDIGSDEYMENNKKRVPRDCVTGRRTNDSKEVVSASRTLSSAAYETKISRSSSCPTTNTISSNVKKEEENFTMQELANSSDAKNLPTNLRVRSSRINSSENRGSIGGRPVTDNKKRASSKPSSSSSLTLTRRIKLRPRPNDIPPEVWLKSSVGRTRQELNNIDDMVQYMGSCRFSQSVVASKFGKVHAIVLNDEWNALAERNDECQIWLVGLGPGRKRDARLVGASQSTIPIFHAPKVEYTTKELFYVGHYRVRDLEELNPPIVQMEKERDMRVTFAFEIFDERLDSIIKRGPDRDA